jgi:hypothetical protein
MTSGWKPFLLHAVCGPSFPARSRLRPEQIFAEREFNKASASLACCVNTRLAAKDSPGTKTHARARRDNEPFFSGRGMPPTRIKCVHQGRFNLSSALPFICFASQRAQCWCVGKDKRTDARRRKGRPPHTPHAFYRRRSALANKITEERASRSDHNGDGRMNPLFSTRATVINEHFLNA